MESMLPRMIFLAGLAQLGVLIASAIVPFRLNWRRDLQVLPRLHRQMFWVYGGYVVLSIVAFALLSILNARELSSGSSLARGFCAYVATFWGIRCALQAVFETNDYLTAWWLRAGYAALTLLFAGLTIVYALGATTGATTWV